MQGNDQQRWEKLLSIVDEKLQFGLLGQLRKVPSYHFEGTTLFLEVPADAGDSFIPSHVVQHLEVMAQSVQVTSIVLKKTSPP